jgi:biotin carboxyl carrier protein
MPDAKKIYKVKANEFEYAFTAEDIKAVDIIKKSPTVFNLLKDHRSVNAKITSIDKSGKRMTIDVEGDVFDVTIKDDLDQLLEKMGFDTVSVKHIKEIKAPMPGLVLEIAVKPGQQVAEGEKILILQAMKMENSILIHTTATIKKILVSPGQAVDKGQVLVELE